MGREVGGFCFSRSWRVAWWSWWWRCWSWFAEGFGGFGLSGPSITGSGLGMQKTVSFLPFLKETWTHADHITRATTTGHTTDLTSTGSREGIGDSLLVSFLLWR